MDFKRSVNRDPSGFVLLSDYVPGIVQEIRYFSTYNFIGDRIDGYEEPVALLTKEAARALKAVANEVNSQGYRYYDLGVPEDGIYRRIFCTYPDGREYKVKSYPDECDGRPHRITIELRPYESVIFEAPASRENDKQATNAEGEENG